MKSTKLATILKVASVSRKAANDAIKLDLLLNEVAGASIAANLVGKLCEKRTVDINRAIANIGSADDDDTVDFVSSIARNGVSASCS
jgi:hypothetical protein